MTKITTKLQTDSLSDMSINSKMSTYLTSLPRPFTATTYYHKLHLHHESNLDYIQEEKDHLAHDIDVRILSNKRRYLKEVEAIYTISSMNICYFSPFYIKTNKQTNFRTT